MISLIQPGGHTPLVVQYLRASTNGATDRYGSPVRTWDPPVTVEGFILDVPASGENGQGIAVSPDVVATLYLPSSYTVATEDKFLITHPRLGVAVECVPQGVGWNVANVFTGATFMTEVKLKVRRG